MEKIEEIEFVEMKESKFLRPYRMLYKQGGQKKLWDGFQAHDSVAILIFNKTRNVFIFVEQFRPPVFVSSERKAKGCEIKPGVSWNNRNGKDGITIELCAGIVDKNMSLEETAQAEVLEECGYKIGLNNLERIVSFPSSVGSSGDLQTMYFAEVEDTMKVSEGGGLAAERWTWRV
eukprot:TRINITY_DN70318_c0_g1_i1.p1 TRINITY_DN70318_c0_g1~~TRINITY_DN70318_c0_g1_i1.p1  ORF type:complete len:175 (-),score=17.22 TRINITY_DN70318_c0_g1_i1:52-576(-)